MDNKIVVYVSINGTIYFDTEREDFYFVDVEGHEGLVEMIRPGWFDLTYEERKAIVKWVKGLLNNGILQSR